LVEARRANAVCRLLAACARAACEPLHHERIGRAAERLLGLETAWEAAWEAVPDLAAAHGMGPLLYTHLRAARVPVPRSTLRTLRGLYARHRVANRIRLRVLGDVLAAFEAAGIRVLVLKGAALVHLVYPEPALRPMSDLDLLVARADLARAQKTLAQLGFRVGPDDDRQDGSIQPRHRHLVPATRRVDGLAVPVEIHHRLFSDYFDAVRAWVGCSGARGPAYNDLFNDLYAGRRAIEPWPFEGAAYTLGHEAMVDHLCRHLRSHVNVWDDARFIWIADVVSYVECFCAEIDWERVRQQYPQVLGMLSALHAMAPLSDEPLRCASIAVGPAWGDADVAYRGWPRVRVGEGREWGYRRILRETFAPAEGWLRLRYGLGAGRSLTWYRWVRHPLHLLGQVGRVVLERAGWPTALALAGMSDDEL